MIFIKNSQILRKKIKFFLKMISNEWKTQQQQQQIKKTNKLNTFSQNKLKKKEGKAGKLTQIFSQKFYVMEINEKCK